MKPLEAPQKRLEAQRINFLFHASHLLQQIQQPQLSRVYSYQLKKINQKLILKNKLKHEICESCCNLLKFSSKQKIKKDKIIVTCNVCNKKKFIKFQ
jgi:RNase P subunit RPR2